MLLFLAHQDFVVFASLADRTGSYYSKEQPKRAVVPAASRGDGDGGDADDADADGVIAGATALAGAIRHFADTGGPTVDADGFSEELYDAIG